jgi:glycosyltransferase involved in cell wall biosynthesis
VVIAARDEEARIEGTLRHLLAQRWVEAEFIVVDDRSTDRTGEILRRLAKEDVRVKVKRVEVLPEGWLGKCYACHVGAGAATGEWILFTDADCWLKPDVIARAVRMAERDRADHVTLSPGTVAESAGTRAWHLLFLISLLNWVSGVNRDRPKSYMGIGAFNLVRAAAYRECGGYDSPLPTRMGAPQMAWTGLPWFAWALAWRAGSIESKTDDLTVMNECREKFQSTCE